MSADGILRSRRALVAGVGQTTRQNRVLPFAPLAVQIPARVGTGQPERKRAPRDTARGFVASPHGASHGYRFDPYTLSVQDSYYGMVGAPYAVMAFATTFHVTDATHWDDVVCFFDDVIEVNAAEMSLLAITTAILSSPSIPYLIKGVGAGNEYGTALLNVTEKRVFAVGRYEVKTWGGGGSTQTLTPTQPRSDSKALTIGQRIDAANNKAWLGQLYYTGSTWDSDAGAWAFSDAEVTMLLAAAYLTKASTAPSVDQTVASLPTSGSGSSGSIDTALTLPATAVGLIGIGEVENAASVYASNSATVVWPYRSTYDAALAGHVHASYTRTTYAASQSATVTQAGVALSYAESNTKWYDSRTENTLIDAQSVATDANTGDHWRQSEYTLASYGNVLTWSDTGSVPAARGNAFFTIPSETISGTAVTRTYENQTLTASVSLSGDLLVNLSLAVDKAIGQAPVITANNSYYSGNIASPYGQVHNSTGMGIALDVWLHAAPNLSYYKNPSGYWSAMPSAAIAEVQAAFDSKQGAFVGTRCYEYEGNSGVYHTGKYSASLSGSTTTGGSSLSWATKDYLLLDADNGVKISIEGTLIGSQTYGSNAEVTLTVILKVQTRYHTTTQTLCTLNFSYSNLFVETQIGATGKYAVPSPKIRVIFAPLYQDQGSFKGAAYVTATEEANGATPAHLFNFSLRLRMYGDLPTCNNDNIANPEVYFVPCNLLEMLYANVFSQDMGVGANRYPVTSSARFSSVQTALFTSAIAVNIRNGTAGAWASSLGGNTARLTRT